MSEITRYHGIRKNGNYKRKNRADIRANRHFQFTAYADVDTYVYTYADLKYRGRVSILSND